MTKVLSDAFRVRLTRAAVFLAALVPATGCASAGHLAEYEFRGRTVGVAMVNAPRPELLTNDVLEVDFDNPLQAVLSIGADLVKEVEASRARPRLYEAATAADVAGRMRERVLHGVAGELRAVPVSDVAATEFEVEVRVKRYGIDADAWLEPAHFFVESEVVLLEAATGRRIWKGKVTEREAITSMVLGLPGGDTFGNDPANDVLTAAALTSLSTEQMIQTLEALADFASDGVLERFRKGLEKSRG